LPQIRLHRGGAVHPRIRQERARRPNQIDHPLPKSAEAFARGTTKI
jgi:hypothetical protein